MFREMRRKKQMLSPQECSDILAAGTSGVLAVLGDGGYPYTVPLSYACQGGRLYFHSALAGHKLDAIASSPRASFCVIAQDRVVPEKFTTYFRSVVVFGRVRILEDPQEKRRALELLAARYSPDHAQQRLREIDRELQRVCMIELAIEHMTGKQAMELVPAAPQSPPSGG